MSGASAAAIIDDVPAPPIELVHATVLRGGRPVLHDLSLTVHEHEHTAILGPNGSGKSSLIRVLTLEDRPLARDDGTPVLRLFGHERWDVIELRRRLGVVTGDLDAGFGVGTSQGRVLAQDVAVSGLLGTHGVFSHHGVTTHMWAQAHEALARVDASHLARRPLNELSAGERRRVLIARALVTRPQVLVLDEPTSGLDIVARHAFMETVRRLAADGTTLVLVTHHVDEIVPETRRVVLLNEGRVVFDGPPGQALTSANLSRVFNGSVTVDRAGGYFMIRHGSRLRVRSGEEPMAKKYGKSASENVERTMRRRKKGTLKSSSGQTVKSRKQAIAIGLSEARAKGAKVPPAPGKRKAAGKKTAGRKTARKKAARKK
jgi:iron complex transport system ATP-binding protein